MFRFYSDPALTTPISTLSATTLIDGGSSAPISAVVYFGKPGAGRQVTPASGTQITVSPADANAGSGLSATAVKLALSEAALQGATPGAALALGASIASGAANSVAIWVSISAGAATAGTYTDLSLITNSMVEADLV